MKRAAIKRIHVVLILDGSGSMNTCRTQVIHGFNKTVGSVSRALLAEKAGTHAFLTLVTFNDEICFTRFAEPLDRLKGISEKDYEPSYSTAMLDAVGSTLSRLEREVEDSLDTAYLVTIWTDGEENASREYSYTHIAKMLQERTDAGRWTFSYVGANHDLSSIAARLGVPKGNLVQYNSDPEGTTRSFDSYARSLKDFIQACIAGEQSTESFFHEGDEIRSILHDH